MLVAEGGEGKSTKCPFYGSVGVGVTCVPNSDDGESYDDDDDGGGNDDDGHYGNWYGQWILYGRYD